jgi:hypothetical protein
MASVSRRGNSRKNSARSCSPLASDQTLEGSTCRQLNTVQPSLQRQMRNHGQEGVQIYTTPVSTIQRPLTRRWSSSPMSCARVHPPKLTSSTQIKWGICLISLRARFQSRSESHVMERCRREGQARIRAPALYTPDSLSFLTSQRGLSRPCRNPIVSPKSFARLT